MYCHLSTSDPNTSKPIRCKCILRLFKFLREGIGKSWFEKEMKNNSRSATKKINRIKIYSTFIQKYLCLSMKTHCIDRKASTLSNIVVSDMFQNSLMIKSKMQKLVIIPLFSFSTCVDVGNP